MELDQINCSVTFDSEEGTYFEGQAVREREDGYILVHIAPEYDGGKLWCNPDYLTW